MDEDSIKKEAEEIEQDLKINPIKEIRHMRYFYWAVAGFLVALMFFFIIPQWTISLDPEPKSIPDISEAVSGEFELTPIDITFPTRGQFYEYVQPRDSVVKQTADYVISHACKGREYQVCYAKALFFFVRDKFAYTYDPLEYEYVKTPRESLRSPVGDCDDASVLLASLLRAEGIDTRFVFIPGHVYVEAFIQDARKKYHDGSFWVAMDPTCNGCGFGEIPYRNQDVPKTRI